MSLRSQRRLAAKILKVGQGRVWIDPESSDYVETAITREEIRRLIHEDIIQSLPKKGVSRSRARVLREKKKRGLRRGSGRKSCSPRARVTKKEAWMKRIRALRKKISQLKNKRAITDSTYRRLYNLANGGMFESIPDLERYIETHSLLRKR